MDNTKKSPDVEMTFMKDQLTNMAKNAAKAGMTADVFEALLIALSEEMDFTVIMQTSRE